MPEQDQPEASLLHSQLRQSHGSLLDALCDRFEESWRTGDPPSIGQFMDELPPPLQSDPSRHQMLMELVLVDMEYRWKSGADEHIHGLSSRPTAQDYAEVFADLKRGGQVPATLFQLEHKLRERYEVRSLESLPTRQRPTLSETTCLNPRGQVPQLAEGQRYLDYEIDGLLGQGAFAKVYFARQVSLDRRVALKVSVNRGNEARTMASLEHDHIVKVLQEQVDEGRNLRILCLQYVPGTTLKDVIGWLHEKGRPCDGESLLQAVDVLNRFPEPISPELSLAREMIAGQDPTEAVSWIGMCLASALVTAHGRGVLHRDIKPANILVSQRGRCYLTDFNLSFDHREARENAGIGGTLAYMSPEHLTAFLTEPGQTPPQVGQQSDVYSLGVVLFEIITGERPFAIPETASSKELHELAAVRSTDVPNCRSIQSACAESLDHIVRKAMDPDPQVRYESAAALGEALTGARDHHRMMQAVPVRSRVAKFAWRHPVMTFVAVGTFANMACLLIVLGHQFLDIYAHVSPALRAKFPYQLAAAMMLPFIPTVLFLIAYLRPIARFWKTLDTATWIDEEEVTRYRRRVRYLMHAGVGVSVVGWLMGAGMTSAVYGLVFGDARLLPHVMLGLGLAAMVACTYAYFVAESVSVLVLYRRMLAYVPTPQKFARKELRGIDRRLKFAQVVAAITPLIGIVSVIYAPGLDEPDAVIRMRVFATAMIVLAVAGFAISVRMGNLIHRALEAMQK